MSQRGEIIDQLEVLIQAQVDQFNERMPGVQRDAFNKILDLTADLETSNGRIKPSVKNIRLIAKIKQELNKTIFSKEYADDLDDLLKTYDRITKLQNAYFTATIGKFTVPKVLAEVQNLAIEGVVESLGTNGIDTNFNNPIRDILVKNVTTGGSRADFTEEVRAFVLGTEGVDGKLVKYAGQVVTDSLNQFSRNYHQVISDDLGFEWYSYDGSTKDTTRPFCKSLIDAKRGCMPYIHKSQLQEVISGQICGSQVPIYDKTGLPAGMIPGTNVANFQSNAGGYNCNHSLNGVPSAIVPKELRDKFERNR